MSGHLDLRLDWPPWPLGSSAQEFFLGGWHADASLEVGWLSPPPDPPPTVVRGRNWFLMGSAGSVAGTCVVHAAGGSDLATGAGAVAFRGYLLAPPLTTWSPSGQVLAACLEEPTGTWNGVFAMARIRDRGRRLELVTDAFGVGPLYYRVLDGLVLFSTHPAWLACPADRPDWMAGRAFLQAGFVTGDRSHTEGVSRVPAAHVLSAQEEGLRLDAWWDYADVADGRQPITPASLGRLEELFQSAVSQCLRLPASQHVVLLSSGDDSRRILAALVSRGVAFRALTVRTLSHWKWDLDAPWAAAMASKFGFPHTVVELPGPREYARLDRQRRSLVDAETNQHTWALTLAPHLPAVNALIFEGLGGDALSETGFEIEELCTADEPRKPDLIAEAVFSEDYERVLRPGVWPPLQQMRTELASWLARLPEGSNRADLAFLLLRTRRSTALFGQQLLPSGNVTVCPYLELQYVREALRYSGVEKLRRSLQAACLERFWPAYYEFPGTRRIPERLRPCATMERLTLAAVRALQDEVGGLRRSGAWALLTGRARALALSSRFSRRVARRCAWWLHPLLALVAKHQPRERGWRLSAP